MIVPEDARIKIRAEMSRCGYTVESLCQSADISQTVLRGILSGKSKSISTRNLYAMGRAFGYEISDFVDLLSGAGGYPEVNSD